MTLLYEVKNGNHLSRPTYTHLSYRELAPCVSEAKTFLSRWQPSDEYLEKVDRNQSHRCREKRMDRMPELHVDECYKKQVELFLFQLHSIVEPELFHSLLFRSI